MAGGWELKNEYSSIPLSKTRRELRPTRRRRRPMKYMLMMHASGAGWKDAGIGTWPPEDIRAHIGFMKRFAEELHQSGELVAAEGLAGPEEARIVRATASGVPEITDGPFAESKEFLAG